MIALELVCLLIVATYVVAHCRLKRSTLDCRLSTLVILAVAGWIGEDSVIRAYGFYAYSPRWHLFLDRVPLMIVLIWPIVIHSAWTLARRLATPARVPLVGAAIVLADASLIEPIAVHAGLWSWTAPGLFAVPPIGILGWAFFAGACIATLTHAEARGRLGVAAVVVGPLATHALLVASWWAALRWLSRPVPAWPAVALAWLVLGGLAWAAVRRRLSRRVPASDLWLRAPGAAFFFVLLGIYGRDQTPLCAWSLAFAPPYVALLLRNFRPE